MNDSRPPLRRPVPQPSAAVTSPPLFLLHSRSLPCLSFCDFLPSSLFLSLFFFLFIFFLNFPSASPLFPSSAVAASPWTFNHSQVIARRFHPGPPLFPSQTLRHSNYAAGGGGPAASRQNIVSERFSGRGFAKSDPAGVIECHSSRKKTLRSLQLASRFPTTGVTAAKQSRQRNIYSSQVAARPGYYIMSFICK